jgi:hypothetical protein
VVTEIKPDGSTAYQVALPFPDSTYRAFVYPWHATPSTPPTLMEQVGSGTVTLTFSWNGATDIASYQVFGGLEPHPTQLLATQPRAGFDTQTVLPYDPTLCSFYRILPIDNQGRPAVYSNEVTTCPPVLTP